MPLSRASFLLALLLAARASHSQNIAPGYIVTIGQDSLRGAIVIQGEMAQQQQVDFITAQGNQRQLLNAYQLKAYGYTTAHDTVRYIAVSLPMARPTAKMEQLFLRQLVAGPAELYRYHYSRDYYAQSASTYTEVSHAPTPANGVTISHPLLAKSNFTSAPGGVLFPPLSAASARGGGGVSLLLRRRGQASFVEANWWTFPADALAYFADCPALAPEIQAKRYRAHTLPQLVQRYNSCQATAR